MKLDRITRALDALHIASLKLSSALQRCAAAINENTNRAKWRALQRSFRAMAQGKRRRQYYDPSRNPQPANPLKGLDKPKRRQYPTDGKNSERIAASRAEQDAKNARRIARNRKSLGLDK